MINSPLAGAGEKGASQNILAFLPPPPPPSEETSHPVSVGPISKGGGSFSPG